MKEDEKNEPGSLQDVLEAQGQRQRQSSVAAATPQRRQMAHAAAWACSLGPPCNKQYTHM